MKLKKTILYILMLLSLAVTGVSLFFLPEQIPAHYNFSGEVDRWGSKYETLIFPVFCIVLGIIMLAVARYYEKRGEAGKSNANASVITGIGCLVLFNAMTAYYLYADFKSVEQLDAMPIDIGRLTFGILGVVMIIAGGLMPEIKMNSLMGLRTPWSRKNEAAWRKSQKFGGASFIIGGILMIALCFTLKGTPLMLSALGVLLVLLAVDVYSTYKIAEKC